MTASLFTGWAFADDALAPLAEGLGCSPASDPAAAVVWIGWSLGGLRALARARLRAPPARLILIASTARFSRAGDWPGLPGAHLRALQRQFMRDPDAALRGFHMLCAPEADPALIARRLQVSRALPTESLRAGLRELAELDLRDGLHELNCPVLILHGANDRIIPAAAAYALAARLPHARVEIHPAAEHDLPLAHPAWVIETMRNFLDHPAGDCS